MTNLVDVKNMNRLENYCSGAKKGNFGEKKHVKGKRQGTAFTSSLKWFGEKRYIAYTCIQTCIYTCIMAYTCIYYVYILEVFPILFTILGQLKLLLVSFLFFAFFLAFPILLNSLTCGHGHDHGHVHGQLVHLLLNLASIQAAAGSGQLNSLVTHRSPPAPLPGLNITMHLNLIHNLNFYTVTAFQLNTFS